MPEQVQSLATPDPILTTEGIGAFVTMLVANIYILFGSNMTNAKQTALATLITGAWLVFTLVHGAVVRKGRAAGGGLVGALINEVPVAGSDPGDK